jgi:hypothetical protein
MTELLRKPSLPADDDCCGGGACCLVYGTIIIANTKSGVYNKWH